MSERECKTLELPRMTTFVRIASLLFAAGVCWASSASAQTPGPGRHYLHHGQMPPGMIGQGQLQRGGPVAGYFQPVEIRGPEGALVATAVENTFGPARALPYCAGFLIGQVYRLRVTNIPRHEGAELFPTIEVIDRLYPPAGQERQFPIVVELIEDDLEQALNGKFVTRVVYLEDPRNALPARSDGQPQSWFDVGPGKDPLLTADMLGRPVAIIRLGARLPGDVGREDDRFFYGCPPLVEYPAAVKVLPRPPVRGPQAPSVPEPAATPAADPSVRARPAANPTAELGASLPQRAPAPAVPLDVRAALRGSADNGTTAAAAKIR